MKVLKLYMTLLTLVILLSQCGRADDPELYQAYYQSPVKEVKINPLKFSFEPNEISLGDTVGFKYDTTLGQVITWIVSLNQEESEATKNMFFVADSLVPSLHFWTGDSDDSSMPFDTINDITVSVSVYKSDTSFTAGLIKFK